MLYALGDPVSLVLLILCFVAAVTLHGWVQSLVAARHGDRSVAAAGRLRPDPRRHVDPFGAVAAAIAGVGWARPVDKPDRRRRGALYPVLLSGAVANLVVGIAALVAFLLAGGGPAELSTLTLRIGEQEPLPLLALLLFGTANVYTGVLSLVPLPPLDGGRLLFALAPRTPGWQKAEYHLDDRNIGVAVLLALLLLALAGPPLLLFVLDTVVGATVLPALDLVTGG